MSKYVHRQAQDVWMFINRLTFVGLLIDSKCIKRLLIDLDFPRKTINRFGLS